MVPKRVVGTEVAQNDGIPTIRQGDRVEAVLLFVVLYSADGQPVHVKDGDGGLAEYVPVADLGGVVGRSDEATGQGGERDPSADVYRYVALFCRRCTCGSAALSSGEGRGLETRDVASGRGTVLIGCKLRLV